MLENSLVDYSYFIQKRQNTYSVIIKSQIATKTNRRNVQTDYLIDMGKKILYREGKAIFESADLQKGLCKEVTDAFISEMGNEYKQRYGILPTVSSGETPTAENEMFESLRIHPTKQIRKMYQKFPQSVVCYAAVQDLGFTDVNILQRSAGSHVYAFFKHFMISFNGGEIVYPLRDSLKTIGAEMHNCVGWCVIRFWRAKI